MKRFLMLVGVAAVAAAVYVAASPASQQAKGPSAKQFNALKKEVASLTKTVKIEAKVISDCDQAAVPIDQFGDGSSATPTEGYEYGKGTIATPTSEFFTTALDVSDTTDTNALYITGGDASCGTLVNGSGLRHVAATAGVPLTRATTHFTAHH